MDICTVLYRKSTTICHAAKPRIVTPETILMARNRRGPSRPRSLPAPSARITHQTAEPANTPATTSAAAP